MPSSLQMLFSDPPQRAPTMTRQFIRMFKLDEREQFRARVKLGSRAAIYAVCGLGDSVLGATLRMRVGADDARIQFECDQLILDYRRTQTETEIKPHIFLEHSDELLIEVETPMLIWVFGTMVFP